MIKYLIIVFGVMTAGIGASAALYFILPPLLVNQHLAPRITVTRIEQLKPGMTVTHVLAALGEPYFISSFREISTLNVFDCPNHKPTGSFYAATDSTATIKRLLNYAAGDSMLFRCNKGNKPHHHTRSTTFLYSKDVAGMGSYPMVWVKFDASLRVSEVYAMKYTKYFGDTYTDVLENAITFYSIGSKRLPNERNLPLMQRLIPH